MPVGVRGVLHGLCLKKGRNLPANLGFGVEFPSHGGQKLSGELTYTMLGPVKNKKKTG